MNLDNNRKLLKSELHLVKPMFRKTVEEAWNRGEEVSFWVTLLSDEPPTENDIKRCNELNKIYKWE